MFLRSQLRAVAGVLVSISALVASDAGAHIEIKPKRAKAGDSTRLAFVVENEQSDARTVKLDVKLPAGVTSVSPRTVRGWRVSLKRSGGEVTRLIFKAPKGAGVGPGEVTGTF